MTDSWKKFSQKNPAIGVGTAYRSYSDLNCVKISSSKYLWLWQQTQDSNLTARQFHLNRWKHGNFRGIRYCHLVANPRGYRETHAPTVVKVNTSLPNYHRISCDTIPTHPPRLPVPIH